jgi:splicing factor U2AF subunit
VHEECSKHGTVLRVVVPRPPVPAQAAELVGTGSYGKAFVQFLELDGAKKVGVFGGVVVAGCRAQQEG